MKKPKEEELKKFPKEKPKISVATAKKVFKPLKREVGQSECLWLNQYVENAVRSSSLPMSLLSNEFLAEAVRWFGEEGGKAFLERLREDFLKTAPKTNDTQ